MFLFKEQTSDIVNMYKYKKFNVWILTQSNICCGHIHSGKNCKSFFVFSVFICVIWLVQMTDECLIVWVFSIYLLQNRKSFRITMFGCMHSLLYCLYRDYLKFGNLMFVFHCFNFVYILCEDCCISSMSDSDLFTYWLGKKGKR